MALKCSVVQTSQEKIEMVMTHLGIDPDSTSDSLENQNIDTDIDTEELLDDLSKTGTCKSHFIILDIAIMSPNGVKRMGLPFSFRSSQSFLLCQ